MTKRRRARGRWVWGVLLLLGVEATALADARSAYLIRLLRTSSAFRVRAQAALSLGRVEGDPAVVRALAAALEDHHPAVRTASASSLELLEDPSALAALETARNDPDSTVRAAAIRAVRRLERLARGAPPAAPSAAALPVPAPSVVPRYYVGVGMPGSQVPRVDRGMLESAQQFIQTRLREVDGVVLAPAAQSRGDAERALRQGQLTGYFIDSSIVRVDEDERGATRAVVSVIVGTYPGRDMRAILEGRATVSGGGGTPTARRQAIEAALTGALRGVPQVMATVAQQAGG